jgi:hypothetical protein
VEKGYEAGEQRGLEPERDRRLRPAKLVVVFLSFDSSNISIRACIQSLFRRFDPLHGDVTRLNIVWWVCIAILGES